MGGNEKDYANAIRQTSDGGYIVGGYTESFGAGDPDFWIVKLERNGDVRWQKTYGDSEWDICNDITETSDGGYSAVGTTQSTGGGEFDIWILNLDRNGNVIWQKSYGGDSYDYAFSIDQTADGGFIIGGYTSSFGVGKIDMWILKLDEGGTISWQKTFGGSEDDFISSVRETSDEGYIVTGYTESFGAGDRDIWVVKLENNGDITWQKTYGRTDYEDCNSSIQQTSDGGYILTGYTWLNASAEGHIWIAKLTSGGSILWENSYEGNDVDYPYAIQQTCDSDGNSSGYILASHTLNNGPAVTTPCDISLLKIDEDGSIEWQTTYRGGVWDNPSSLQHITDGGFIIAGYTAGDVLILKIDENGGIPNCEKISDGNFVAKAGSFTVTNSNCSIQTADCIVNETNIVPQKSSAELTTICEGDD
jgi:hypothetical protein